MTWLVLALVVAVIALCVFGAWKLSSKATSFASGAALNAVTGAVAGAALIVGITYVLQQNTRPEPTQLDPQSSLLDRVEYGSR